MIARRWTICPLDSPPNCGNSGNKPAKPSKHGALRPAGVWEQSGNKLRTKCEHFHTMNSPPCLAFALASPSHAPLLGPLRIALAVHARCWNRARSGLPLETTNRAVLDAAAALLAGSLRVLCRRLHRLASIEADRPGTAAPHRSVDNLPARPDAMNAQKISTERNPCNPLIALKIPLNVRKLSTLPTSYNGRYVKYE